MRFYYNPTRCQLVVHTQDKRPVRIPERAVRLRLKAIDKQVGVIKSFVYLRRIHLCWKGYDYFMRWLHTHRIRKVFCVLVVEKVEVMDTRLVHSWGSCEMSETPLRLSGVTKGRCAVEFRDFHGDLVHKEVSESQK